MTSPAAHLAALERAVRNAGHGHKQAARRRLSAALHAELAREVYGSRTTVAWFPIGLPVPEGWRLVKQEPSHHSHYSQMVERI